MKVDIIKIMLAKCVFFKIMQHALYIHPIRNKKNVEVCKMAPAPTCSHHQHNAFMFTRIILSMIATTIKTCDGDPCEPITAFCSDKFTK